MQDERLTIRIPKGWKKELAAIAKTDDRDISYVARLALKRAFPTLEKRK